MAVIVGYDGDGEGVMYDPTTPPTQTPGEDDDDSQ